MFDGSVVAVKVCVAVGGTDVSVGSSVAVDVFVADGSDVLIGSAVTVGV